MRLRFVAHPGAFNRLCRYAQAGFPFTHVEREVDGGYLGAMLLGGQNAKGLESLKDMFEQHCEDDDRRHGENVKLLKENNEAIKGLADTLAPIVANYKLTKRRLAFVATLGIGLLIALSWALEEAIRWAVGWLLKIKFGV